MAEDFKGTTIEKGKGFEESFEVDELIRQTLEESKRLAPTPAPAASPAPAVKREFKATPVTMPAQAKETVAQPSYEETFRGYEVGKIIKGTVVKADPGGVLVDIKYKADGLIPPEDLHGEELKVGDIIDVYIENLESKEGYVVLSKKRADHEIKWQAASEAYRQKKILESKVIQALQGGLVVDCDGIRGFIPASQVAKKAEVPLESFVGQNLPVKVIEINRRQGKVVLSHKLGAGEKERFQSDKLIEELEVGQIRRGKVSSLKSFGAFVDLGGVEGLIHLSELSWKRVKHPSELLKMGQELDVFVLGVDKETKKVALGLKELQPDPWVNAAELYQPGQTVKAKILRFAKFGAFAELEHGLEGLIHISELSKNPVRTPEEAAKIGDVVEVKILRVIAEEQKIGLSVKEAQAERERSAAKEAAPAPAEEKKVTIADMLAEKEKAKAEKEAAFEEAEEETVEESPT